MSSGIIKTQLNNIKPEQSHKGEANSLMTGFIIDYQIKHTGKSIGRTYTYPSINVSYFVKMCFFAYNNLVFLIF